MPAVRNMTVALNDRKENRDKPHTPCPLVQPLPIAVPKPTNKPPKTKIKGEVLSADKICEGTKAW